MSMKVFSKKELKIVAWVLTLIILFSLVNFKTSLKRARDQQRKTDLSEAVKALSLYAEEFGFFPPSSDDGEIMACSKGDFELPEEFSPEGEADLKELFDGCVWGKDSLRDLSDETHPPYLEVIPGDPDSKDGSTYFYVSNTKNFQVFAYLEDEKDELIKKEIIERNIKCGMNVCNYGKSIHGVPLDISLDEYEKKLLEKNQQVIVK